MDLSFRNIILSNFLNYIYLQWKYRFIEKKKILFIKKKFRSDSRRIERAFNAHRNVRGER